MRTIIIGLGNIGLLYDADLDPQKDYVLTHTRACMTHPGIRLVAGVDPDPARRKLFHRLTQQKAFASVTEVVSSIKEADIVIVATPPDLRRSIIEACWELNPKAFLVEKPIATTLAEADWIVQRCHQNNIVLAVNYQRRFDPAFQSLRQFFQNDPVGCLRSGSCYYTNGALNNASHFVDLMIYFLGEPSGVEGLPARQNAAGHFFRCRYENADICFIPIEANYGLLEMDLIFENARIRLTDYGRTIQVYGIASDTIFSAYTRLRLKPSDLPQPDGTRYQYRVMDSLLTCLGQSQTPPSNGVTATATLACCLKGIHAT